MKVKDRELLHITKKHNGKMEGMWSLSTSCEQNPYCAERSKIPGSICEKCYAKTMMLRFKDLEPCMRRNGEILSSKILKKSELPILNVNYFRFEAFGDLINTTHVINYFNICKLNPETHFALWTKNPKLIHDAIYEGHEKPDNLQIILSSQYINVKIINKWDFVDKVFTVYDRMSIIQNGIKTNCKGKNCLECKLCYQKNGVKDIREKLK